MGSIIVFVARASPQEASDQKLARDRLRESLNLVIQNYEHFYGCTCQSPRFYTFIHDSDQPLRSGGSVFQYFANLLDEGQDKGCDVTLVLNGWDTLTVDKMTFVRLFGHVSAFDIDVNVKVFVNQAGSTNPSQFFNINPTEACALLTGDLDPTRDVYSDDDTRFFIHTINNISADMYLRNHSEEEVRRLLIGDETRNDYPGWSGSRH
ncbi:hypothetical protein N7471_004699 [Penicillium samsonianum]|uniref:uncharacterized protein n=1 Tax=Penicillium samsonianum TaxID=1882272 RepID=UPI002547AF9C|nr:uncharacterized protein N7471_004699 [Penicillium samsonianum]KAJ6138213.1 hypothetical protein N7471_004699 [Penicillium samsonianum]